MKLLKYVLWSPIITFISILIFGMFAVILDYEFTELLCKIWASLGLISFFCLALLATIDKSEKSINTK